MLRVMPSRLRTRDHHDAPGRSASSKAGARRGGVRRAASVLACLLALPAARSAAQAPADTFTVWPGTPPGAPASLPPEVDTTAGGGERVAGRSVIRLGNVTTPTLTVYKPAGGTANGTAVVICPGGGHRILAMDLEGSEAAAWLNSLGVTAFVLKYRVPTRPGAEHRWDAAVEDGQRAMSLVRSRAAEFGIDPGRLGMLGFSAGGETAGLTAFLRDRRYARIDAVDDVPYRPDFVMLGYAAGMVTEDGTALRDYVAVTPASPPTFIVQAQDDFVPVQNALRLGLALKQHGVPFELHVYAAGGHGYGLRETEAPVTTWHHRAADWLRARGLLTRR